MIISAVIHARTLYLLLMYICWLFPIRFIIDIFLNFQNLVYFKKKYHENYSALRVV